jgi:UDP-glucose 4-epimerase
MTKILITGGAGFIGSHLARHLLNQDYEVIIFDNFDNFYPLEMKKMNLASISSKDAYVLVKGDIRDYESFCSALEDVQVVIHEAAQPGIRISLENPMKTHEVNATGTLNVLRASQEKEVERVIFASSSSVYGDVNILPFIEECTLFPASPYGVSKLIGEQYARVFWEVYGLSTVSLRYFSVYGPRIRPDLVIPIFTNMLSKNEKPSIFGDGEQSRDFTYIDDIVDATIRSISQKGIDGEVFNIGTGETITINRIYQIIQDLLDKNIPPRYLKEKKGEVRHTHSDITKAKERLGYTPRYTIEKGLKKYLQWYHDNTFYV